MTQKKDKAITGTKNPAGILSKKGDILILLSAIILLTFITFYPASKNYFINWDDNGYVFENAHLQKPLPQAIKYFAGPHYFIGNYIPLTMTVYAIEYHLAGKSEKFFHLVNIFIHLINVGLIFWFVFLLSEKKTLVAGFVSLFFGIHPMHVESVAWVAELKDVLYCFFFISGLIAYLYYLERNKGKIIRTAFPFYAFLLFILSVLAKPAAVVFPVILLLIDFYRGRTFNRKTWLEKIPFVVISVIFGIIAIRAQQADRLMHDDYTFFHRLFFASYSFLNYTYKLFLPLNLAIFHPYPRLVDGHLPVVFYLSPLICIALFYFVYRTLKHSRLLTFGFLFFVANVILVLQLVSVGDAMMAERYTYVSYTGLLFIVGMGFEQLVTKSKSYGIPVLISTIVIGFIFAYISNQRCKVWRNDVTIADDLLRKYPDDRLALNNKGFILYSQQKFKEANEFFIKAIEIKPDYTMASINLTNSYLELNEYNKALQTVDSALTHAPTDFNLLNNKGHILYKYFSRYDEAIKYFNASLQQKPDNEHVYLNLSECYYMMKNYDKVMETIETALKYGPRNFVFLNNKGYMLFLKGDYEGAEEYYKASLSINPDYKLAVENLEICRRAMSDSTKTGK